MRRVLALLLVVLIFTLGGYRTGSQNTPSSKNSSRPTIKITLPLRDGSVRFLVVGDTGTGATPQQQLANVMVESRLAFPFEFVLLMGDNLYGPEMPEDYEKKFKNVYKKLLDDKVTFYATLGNHDEPNQRFYALFNMQGEEFYRFKKANVAFYSLNSNYMDARQLKWLEEELAKDPSDWKILFMHHPLYSSARKHGSDIALREVLEPLILKYGVNAVFAGHDHVYERIKPQNGVYYFVSGAGSKPRIGDVRKGSSLTEKAFDRDLSFMLLEIFDDQMHFQVISRTGETVDSGVLMNQRKTSIEVSR